MESIASKILSHPAPVVFWDTCSLLDVLRSQHRLQTPRFLIQKALNAVGLAVATPARLHLVISQEVELEFNRNFGLVQADLKDHFSTLYATGASLLIPEQLPSWQSSIQSIEDGIRGLMTQILASCKVIPDDAICRAKAHFRISQGIAPGRKGNSNLGDCLVVEHMFGLVRILRTSGFTEPCIFLSSNRRDFGLAPMPKPPLDETFNSLNIDYLPDIEAAVTLLGY